MRAFFRQFAENQPTLHLFIVGFGGMILITTVIDLAFYAAGGLKLMQTFGFISIGCGVIWFVPKLLDFRFRIQMRELDESQKSAFKTKM